MTDDNNNNNSSRAAACLRDDNTTHRSLEIEGINTDDCAANRSKSEVRIARVVAVITWGVGSLMFSRG